MLHLEHKSYYEMGTSKGFVPLRPFGPSIGHATLPEQTIKDFNADFEKGRGYCIYGSIHGNKNTGGWVRKSTMVKRRAFLRD